MEQIIQEILKHIAVLNDDFTALAINYNQMAIDIAVLKMQMSSVMWLLKLIAGAFVIAVLTQIWQLILMKKNNGK